MQPTCTGCQQPWPKTADQAPESAPPQWPMAAPLAPWRENTPSELLSASGLFKRTVMREHFTCRALGNSTSLETCPQLNWRFIGRLQPVGPACRAGLCRGGPVRQTGPTRCCPPTRFLNYARNYTWFLSFRGITPKIRGAGFSQYAELSAPVLIWYTLLIA